MVLIQPQSSNHVRWSSRGVTLPPGTPKNAMIRLAGSFMSDTLNRVWNNLGSLLMRVEPKDRLIESRNALETT